MAQYDQNEAAAKQAEDRRKAREAAKKTAEDTLSDQRKDQTASNAEAMRRMDESQPTPTQHENDMARLGVHVEKEDDGSGPDPRTLSPEDQKKLRERRAAEAGGGTAPYRTRQAGAAPGPALTNKPVA